MTRWSARFSSGTWCAWPAAAAAPRCSFLYGGGLLVALAFVYAQHFPGHDLLALSGGGEWVSLEEQARFAHSFANTLLLAQNVAVLVLVPAFLAGAVAEEKEKKTLPLLFTTALTDREIVLGKMLGRLLHVGGVLLVGLPVLSLAEPVGRRGRERPPGQLRRHGIDAAERGRHQPVLLGDGEHDAGRPGRLPTPSPPFSASAASARAGTS